MRVPKGLRLLIGTEYDKDKFYEAAALNGIRLCKVFSHSVEFDDSVDPPKQIYLERRYSNYYTSFRRFNIVARDGYMRAVLRKESQELERMFTRIKKRAEQINVDDDMLHQDVLNRISEELGVSLTELNDVVEASMETLQRTLDRMQPALDRGYLYPWEKLKYKTTCKVNLPELPRERFKGKALVAQVNHGLIQSLEMERP